MKLSLLLLLAGSWALSSQSVTSQTPVLLRTFTNPTPAVGDNFGASLAPLGNDRVLIGAMQDNGTIKAFIAAPAVGSRFYRLVNP